MNVEKMVNLVTSNFKSDSLYTMIEYGLLVDEQGKEKDINIKIIENIIKIISKNGEYKSILFTSEEDEELYSNISEEISDLSKDERKTIKDALRYLVDLYSARKRVIEKLHPSYDDITGEEYALRKFSPQSQVVLEFKPKDKKLFKQLLMEQKQAKRTIYYKNGKINVNYWNVQTFSINSNLLANIKSSQLYRNAVEKGIEKILFEIENYNESRISDMIKDAELGYSSVQYRLGNMYFNGIEVEQDYDKAIYWYEQASKHFNKDALYALGIIYFKGISCKPNYEKAFDCFKRVGNIDMMEEVAVHCNGEIQFNLASMFENGNGCRKNYKKAFNWYGKAAIQGLKEAGIKIALMYLQGRLHKEYLESAIKILENKNINEDRVVQYSLASIYDNVFRNERMALKWALKSAKQDYPTAQCLVGIIYDCDFGDREKATEWYEKAALNGDMCAQHNLGFMYLNGDSFTEEGKDLQLAYKWLKFAAEQGDKDAIDALQKLKLIESEK